MSNTPLDIAKELLGLCIRYENRDHAFGDREVFWKENENDQHDVAEGYFGGGDAEVCIISTTTDETVMKFTGNEARELGRCGRIVHIGRNDETGPDRYEGA